MCWLLSPTWVFTCGSLYLKCSLCLALWLGFFPSSDLKYYRLIYYPHGEPLPELRFPVNIVWPAIYFIELITMRNGIFVYLLIICLPLPSPPPPVSCCLLPLPGPPSGQGFIFSGLQCILSPKFSSWCMMKAQCVLVEWISGRMVECSGIFVSSCPSPWI